MVINIILNALKLASPRVITIVPASGLAAIAVLGSLAAPIMASPLDPAGSERPLAVVYHGNTGCKTTLTFNSDSSDSVCTSMVQTIGHSRKFMNFQFKNGEFDLNWITDAQPVFRPGGVLFYDVVELRITAKDNPAATGTLTGSGMCIVYPLSSMAFNEKAPEQMNSAGVRVGCHIERPISSRRSAASAAAASSSSVTSIVRFGD